MEHIELIQKPIVKHQLLEIGKQITERLLELDLDNQVATEDTISFLKEVRAELNKQAVIYETQRKAVKEMILAPYAEMEEVYKIEVINKFKDADAILKDKIAFVENKIKQEKKNELVAYFNELCQVENIDFVKFEQMNLSVNLSTSVKKLKQDIYNFLSKIVDDLRLIYSQDSKLQAEILVSFKLSLNASKSIRDVIEKEEAKKIEQERLILLEIQKRQSILTSNSYVYSDLTKSYHHIKDENIFFKLNEIECLNGADFAIKLAKNDEIVNSKNEVIKAPEVAILPPKKEEKEEKEELFTAVFECEITIKQAGLLKEFLITNNITYKNI